MTKLTGLIECTLTSDGSKGYGARYTDHKEDQGHFRKIFLNFLKVDQVKVKFEMTDSFSVA